MSEALRKRLMLVLRIVVSVGMLVLLLTKIEDQGKVLPEWSTETAVWLTGAVLLYLIDPLDLFPDIVPLLGWADDAVIVPAGLWLASRFIPPQVMDDARQRFAKKPPVK